MRSGPIRVSGNWRSGLAVAVALLLGACGLTAPRHDEGFADLDSPGMFDTDRRVVLSIGPAILHFAARHLDDEPEIQAMMRELEGLRVRVYEIDGNGARVARRMERMSHDLRAHGWEPVALIREKDEWTHLLVKSRAGRIQGLTLIATDGSEEAVVINLIGHLEPRHFNQVLAALEVDAPEIGMAVVD